MGKKLAAHEIDFLFRASLFMDGTFRDNFFRLLIEHFCDCSDEKESPSSDSLAASTTRGHEDNG